MHSNVFTELMGLIDNPPDDMIFYHYCSPETYLSICTGKRLRFSDLNSMNDYLEGSWGYNKFIEVCNQLLESKETTLECVDKIDEVLHVSSYMNLKLICSLSKSGDVLSQWRAYANNGNGFAIGFFAKNLNKMPIRVLDVIYDEDLQKKNLSIIITTLTKLYNIGEVKSFEDICDELSVSIARFKNPAFKEEMEVRLIHVATLDLSDKKNPKHIFNNGYVDGEPVNYEIKYRMNDCVPTAYIDFDFCYKSDDPIAQVVLGPKNSALPTGVKISMSTLGLKNVDVISSTASYR